MKTFTVEFRLEAAKLVFNQNYRYLEAVNASVSSQEFPSKAPCEKAQAIFEVKFKTLRSINGIAYCVGK